MTIVFGESDIPFSITINVTNAWNVNTHTHTHTHTHTRVANLIIHFMHILLANEKGIFEIKEDMYVTAFY